MEIATTVGDCDIDMGRDSAPGPFDFSQLSWLVVYGIRREHRRCRDIASDLNNSKTVWVTILKCCHIDDLMIWYDNTSYFRSATILYVV